jgi:GNAT superfamily N-acetyltransferase
VHVIRPIRPDDKSTLLRLFGGLSDETRIRRFLRVTKRLDADDLAALTEFDREQQMAFVVVDDASSEPIAVGRYVRDPADRESAALAVVVADAHQGQGIGTRLVRHLARDAAAAGIRTLTALMFYDNDHARHVLRCLGPVRVIGRDIGVVEFAVDLAAA